MLYRFDLMRRNHIDEFQSVLVVKISLLIVVRIEYALSQCIALYILIIFKRSDWLISDFRDFYSIISGEGNFYSTRKGIDLTGGFYPNQNNEIN